MMFLPYMLPSGEDEDEDESAEPCGAFDPDAAGFVCTKRQHPKSPYHKDESEWGAVFSWSDVPVLLTPDTGEPLERQEIQA